MTDLRCDQAPLWIPPTTGPTNPDSSKSLKTQKQSPLKSLHFFEKKSCLITIYWISSTCTIRPHDGYNFTSHTKPVKKPKNALTWTKSQISIRYHLSSGQLEKNLFYALNTWPWWSTCIVVGGENILCVSWETSGEDKRSEKRNIQMVITYESRQVVDFARP